MPQEGVSFAPQAELQTLLAKNAIKRLFDDAAFLLYERLTQGRRQPAPHRLGIVRGLIQISVLRLDFRSGYLRRGVCPVR
jgi:hypothetical protein